jgi:hypothetical protein
VEPRKNNSVVALIKTELGAEYVTNNLTAQEEET